MFTFVVIDSEGKSSDSSGDEDSGKKKKKSKDSDRWVYFTGFCCYKVKKGRNHFRSFTVVLYLMRMFFT